jgi:hypothetical protein
MPRCANPACPDAPFAGLAIQHHWVQVQEVQLQQAGHAQSVGAVQHHFAAVTCSKRCAVAVLNAELPAEEAERRERQKLFGRPADAD